MSRRSSAQQRTTGDLARPEGSNSSAASLKIFSTKVSSALAGGCTKRTSYLHECWKALSPRCHHRWPWEKCGTAKASNCGTIWSRSIRNSYAHRRSRYWPDFKVLLTAASVMKLFTWTHVSGIRDILGIVHSVDDIFTSCGSRSLMSGSVCSPSDESSSSESSNRRTTVCRLASSPSKRLPGLGIVELDVTS